VTGGLDPYAQHVLDAAHLDVDGAVTDDVGPDAAEVSERAAMAVPNDTRSLLVLTAERVA
jgi:hypothetical protein